MSREIINYLEKISGYQKSTSSLIGLAMDIYKKSFAFEIDRAFAREIDREIIKKIKNDNYEW